MRLSRDLEKKLYFRHFEKSPISTSISFVTFFSLSLVKSHDKRFVFRNFPRSRGMGNSNCRIGATSSRVVAPDNCAISPDNANICPPR